MIKKKKKRASRITLVLACVSMIIGSAVLLYDGALYLEAKATTQESRQRIEIYDVMETENLEDSYKTMWVQAVSDPFATESNEKYTFHIFYDYDYKMGIVKMDQEQFAKMKELNDFMYESFGSEKPEAMQIIGTATAFEDDIIQYAIDMTDYMFGEGIITKENFHTYHGYSYLDLTRGPNGGVDYEHMRDLACDAGLAVFVGFVFFLIQMVKLINEGSDEVIQYEELE